MDSNRMIGERIGKLITEKGITQQVLSDRIGVKRETVVQWLNGSRKIKAEHIIMLCKALDVSADYLLGLSEIESLDPDVKACYHYTGLSETALYTLHNYESEISATLSKLIEYHEFWHLLCDISNFDVVGDDLRTTILQIEEPETADTLHTAISRYEDELKSYRLSRYDVSESFSALIATIFQPNETIDRALEAVAVRTKPKAIRRPD